MLRLLCTAEFDDGWTERFGKLVEIDRVGFSLDKDPGGTALSQQPSANGVCSEG